MQNIKTFITMVKQELYIITPRQKRLSVLLFFAVTFGSLYEMLGVSALLPLVEALMDVGTLSRKWYAAPLINLLKLEEQNEIIFTMAALVVVVYLLKNLYLLWSLNLQYKFRYEFQRELSSRMLAAYMRRPYEYFLGINSAQVLRSIEGDVIGVFGIYEYMFKMLSETLTVIFIGAFLLYIDWIMASGVLLLSLVCFFGVTSACRILLRGAGEKGRAAELLTKKYAYQAVNGIKEIHVMKKNEYFIRKYDEAYYEKSRVEKKQALLGNCPEKIIEASCVAGMLAIVCLRVVVGVNMQEFIPSMSAFAVAAFRILPSVSRFVGYVGGLIYQRPALEAAYNQLHDAEEYEAFVNEYTRENMSISSGSDIQFRNRLELHDICWKYPGADKEIVCNLNLTISKGEAVGFIGSSGSGKTTLIDLILGLFQPLSGKILMDGIDIYTIPQEWAAIIGYVPQSVYLADDTLRNNIAFGTDESMIDDAKVWSALKQAQLLEFAQSLPKGLDTLVGEHGIKFSGGQRQRVAIARALYYNPDILVLDEATSALDNETESAVMEAIDTLQGHKTLIIVAHRLSTLKNCDKVYEVKEGKAFAVTL